MKKDYLQEILCNEFKFRIFERDNFVCQFCETSFFKLKYTKFYIQEIHYVGTNLALFWNPSNYFSLCEKCYKLLNNDLLIDFELPNAEIIERIYSKYFEKE